MTSNFVQERSKPHVEKNRGAAPCACAAGGVQCGRGCRDPAARAAALRRERGPAKGAEQLPGRQRNLKVSRQRRFPFAVCVRRLGRRRHRRGRRPLHHRHDQLQRLAGRARADGGEQLARQPRGGGPDQRGAELFRCTSQRHVEPAAAGRVCLAPGRPISGCLSI